MKRILLIMVVTLAVAGMAFAGGQKEAEEKEAVSQEEEKEKAITVGVSYASLDLQFFQFYQKGIQEAAEAAGIKLVEMDSFYDAEKQVSNIESLITQDVDAMIVQPVDEAAVVAGVMAANRANIPVFALDRPPAGGEISGYLSAGHEVIGPMQAKFIAGELDGEGNVVLVQGPLGESYTRKLTEGVEKLFRDEYPDITILDKQSAGGWDRAKAMAVMEDFIQKHGEDIDAVIATSDLLAMGAVQALKAADILDEVAVVGADADLDMLQGIKKGEISGTVNPLPYLSGKIALDAAVLLAQGKKLPEAEMIKGIPTLDLGPEIYVITQENVDKTDEWGVVPVE